MKFLDDLEDLGYTDERARQIRASAQVERDIRFQTGSPSNLTPNQLDFIQTNRIGGRRVMINEHFQVFTDADGRQYVNDNRVREVDGTPARLFLPAPEQFNPLTLQQQEEQQRRIDEARPDFLEDFIDGIPKPLLFSSLFILVFKIISKSSFCDVSEL